MSVSCCMTSRSEEIRIRYKYRKLILTGKVRISHESAKALVGPDCAFHLYGSQSLPGSASPARSEGEFHYRSRTGRSGKDGIS